MAKVHICLLEEDRKNKALEPVFSTFDALEGYVNLKEIEMNAFNIDPDSYEPADNSYCVWINYSVKYVNNAHLAAIDHHLRRLVKANKHSIEEPKVSWEPLSLGEIGVREGSACVVMRLSEESLKDFESLCASIDRLVELASGGFEYRTSEYGAGLHDALRAGGF